MKINLPEIQFPKLNIQKQDNIGKYQLPSKVIYCKKCVISNQRPRIVLDDEGVCGACRYAEYKNTKIDWNKRDLELQELCDKHRRKDGQFDVIVPCSGGKDSAFVAHMLKNKYGMNPLTVTWAPNLYMDVGWKNIQHLIHTGLHNITWTPDGETHRILTRLSFIHLGDPFQPFIYGVKTFPLRLAVMFNIPLIVYGENGEVEYGGDMKNANSPCHDTRDDLKRHYFSGMNPESWVDYGLAKEKLEYYLSPSQEALAKVGVQCHFMGYYKRWVPQEMYYYACENTGFAANPEGRSEGTYSKYASLDDRLDGFHFYMAHAKFGIGRATSDAAHEVRDGHISREEAIALVKRYDGEFPGQYFDEFLDYTGLSKEDFEKVVNSHRSDHLWEKIDNQYKLKTPVWES